MYLEEYSRSAYPDTCMYVSDIILIELVVCLFFSIFEHILVMDLYMFIY